MNSLTVFNSTGNKISLMESINENNALLDVSDFDKGLYFIKIKLISGEILVKKFVVRP